MSFGVAVQQLDAAGGPHIVEANDPWFRVEGKPIAVLGDLVQSHAPPPHSPNPPMAEGSAWFRVGPGAGPGIPVCRQGHQAVCGHETTGRPWFRIAP